MIIFDEIERLINEHGSSTILKERILLLKDQHAVLTNQISTHQREISLRDAKILTLEQEISILKENSGNLQLDNNNLRNKIDSFHSSNPEGHVCDYCGSKQLKRIGNRPNSMFGDVGIKDAIFQCKDCDEETAVIIEPSK